jgi:predicted enzyme related to lactoylglutathione lyase
MTDQKPPGSIGWMDRTVAHATHVRDFYASVVGWGHESLSMGDYDDYGMTIEDGTWVSGTCHARGENADLPPQWLMYVIVADLDASLAAVQANGGERVTRIHGNLETDGGFCVVRDPAGAVLALMQGGPAGSDGS